MEVEMDFSHRVIIALVVALGIPQAASFAMQARIPQKIHDGSNEMKATVRTPLTPQLQFSSV
jgi:hypothetical protein